MRKTLRVLRHELLTAASRPSYVFFTFLLPVLAILVTLGLEVVRGRGWTGFAGATPEAALQAEGYVDHSGLVRRLPADLPAGQLVAYASESEAQRAMQVGDIAAYYIIPVDYIQRGEIEYIYPDERSVMAAGQDRFMRWALLVNLLGGDSQTAGRIWEPIQTLEHRSLALRPGTASGEDCTRPGSACRSNDLVRFLPALMAGLFFVSYLSSGSLLLESVGAEKDNRTLEVLLLSLPARHLLAGKALGLALAGLLQTLTWLASVLVVFTHGEQALRIPAGFTFPASIAAWSLVFFLGGYAVYASLMAGVGALAPRMKETGAANMLAMAPMLAGYLVGVMAPIAGLTQASFTVALSLFPLTAPIVMIMRLTDGDVPAWQLLLSAGLTYATAVFAFRSVAALFHAQVLLSGRPFSVRRYLWALLGRV